MTVRQSHGRPERSREVSDPRPLNVVHICDHLGWEGSRMHGVKRLFAWMIPRFDASRYRVSLISLRRKDLSADTLEEFGIDVTYMARHKFDPATFPELLKVLRAKQADIVHLHGSAHGGWASPRSCTSTPIMAIRHGFRRWPIASLRRTPISPSPCRNQPVSSRPVRD
jgi:hypothetical protein